MDGTLIAKKYDLMGGGGGGGGGTAASVSYDNTESGLTAETVQDAIDEVVDELGDVEDVVGDADGGLVKAVSDIATTVGNADGGLVKAVNDVASDVTGLSGDVTDLQNANKYLTAETLVGKWGNANLYRKYVTTGALPSIALKSFDIGITTETVRRIEMYYDSNAEFGPFPNNEGTVSFNKSTKKLDVATAADYSGYTGVVIVEYTK